jgi:cellulose synthase/poly-beta-1,6-N-acetylglucosamine synthase-like glycosyltransferase
MTPLVSILIAARNEEDNILDLLNSIEQLSYPKSSLQILLGNDNSNDRTGEIIVKFISQKPHYQSVNIIPNQNNLKGKANVLAQLAHHARGEYFFFADADIVLPSGWVEGMLFEFKVQGSSHDRNNLPMENRRLSIEDCELKTEDCQLPTENYQLKIGVVNGTTTINYQNSFEACQAVEMLMALNLMKTLTKFGLETTGMGNNMAVTAEAYWAVGGYEKIGFSIVEDYALYKAIIDKGYGFGQGFDASVLAFTKPPKNYFEQRKRWVSGGMSTKSNLIVLALIQAFALPILLIISFLNWEIALSIFTFSFLLNLFLGFKISLKLKLFSLIKYIPAYTIYMYVFWFLQIINYFLPTKLVWKGREYL